jgi:hypothetical protein
MLETHEPKTQKQAFIEIKQAVDAKLSRVQYLQDKAMLCEDPDERNKILDESGKVLRQAEDLLTQASNIRRRSYARNSRYEQI